MEMPVIEETSYAFTIQYLNMHTCILCLYLVHSLEATASALTDTDKAVKIELTKCSTVFATDVPRQITEKM